MTRTRGASRSMTHFRSNHSQSRNRWGTYLVEPTAGRPSMFVPDLLKGKRILVTGGGTGLGKSMGRRFLELGAELVICGRRRSALEETTAEFQAAFPGRGSSHASDMRDADASGTMLRRICA